MKPKRIEFDVGSTHFKQSVSLFAEAQANGTHLWTIVRCPANQRDDAATIFNLPGEVILKMAKAVESLDK